MKRNSLEPIEESIPAESDSVTTTTAKVDDRGLQVEADQVGELDTATQELTSPFVGRWQTLISQTNWEKGRIISEWRSALMAESAPASMFSDETWAKQVGAVTGQHVGRLRRVYERFGTDQPSFPGLFWSHFLAALDWDDAELWLEGAARSQWSVSSMRRIRWESMGSNPSHAPKDEELITSEVNEDFDALVEASDQVEADREGMDRIGASGPLTEGPDFGDADDAVGVENSDPTSNVNDDAPWDQSSDSLSNPFANLATLPADVEDALEQFKLCIIRHRASLWVDMPKSQMLQAIDALREFANR